MSIEFDLLHCQRIKIVTNERIKQTFYVDDLDWNYGRERLLIANRSCRSS